VSARINPKGENIIEIKRKPAELLIRILCGFLALFTLFMLTMSLIFSIGGDAPSLFGRNIYIVKTDAVEALKPGTALFTRAVPFDEISSGDIVVFNSGDRIGLAEIETAEQSENVYRYEAISERGVEIILVQSQIIGKATQYSSFFGALISFAKSSAGVMLIAVIPCIIILVFEASKAIFGVFKKENEITPVKKQDEIPTYIPRQKFSKPRHDDEDEYDKMLAEAAADDGFGAFGADEEDDFPLFKTPKSKAFNVGKPEEKKPSVSPRTAPLSQKRLNQAIAEVNARGSTSGFSNSTESVTGSFSFAEREPLTSETTEIKKLSTEKPAESVKPYTPKRKAAQSVSHTASMPSLDRLLREDDPEVENTRYDIGDILFSIDKKR
jgi:hypothetical protein